ncbi:MAG TPA: LptF/LptG family permease [Candidatus Eisenbacteria bacterium]
MRVLHSYILRLHLVPFLLGFGVVTFILVMDMLFDYLDLIVNRGVAITAVGQLFALSLGYIVALSVPCAVLVAVLMTFGRLSQDNEITALRASGVHLGSVLVGPLLVSALLAAGLTLFNNYVLPESNHAFANLLIDIHRMRPTVKLQEGVFVTDLPGYNLLVQSVNGRTNEMRGITIYQINADGPPTTIMAKRGFLSYTPDGRTAVLELRDGEIHEIPADEGGARKYRRVVFKTHVINVPGAGAILERSARSARSDREVSARALLDRREVVVSQYRHALDEHLRRFQRLNVPRALLSRLGIGSAPPWALLASWRGWTRGHEDPLETLGRLAPMLKIDAQMWQVERESYRKQIARLTVEIHKKFSLPMACVVFVLIGAPIGMRVRRAGPAVAFLSVAFFLFYWLCLIGGEELANRLIIPAWLAMWLPNLVLGAMGLDWTLKACEVDRPWSRPSRVRLAPAADRSPATA